MLTSQHAAAAGLEFLSGGGELGELIRQFDWSRTPLGPLDQWPQSLKTATAILLRSPVPIVLLWGADGIMIYNDAYAAFGGARHPRLLGSKVLEGWPEVADFNANVMRVGMAGGTLTYRDQHLILHRQGRAEDAWMNLDYSPVLDEAGRPAGVLAIVVETTERVVDERRESLREEARVQGLLARVSQALVASQLDLEQVVQTATDVAAELTGAAFGAFFYNMRGGTGETHTLYTLSGAPREAFSRFPHPRSTDIFGPTFRGEAMIRSADITADARYGHNAPYYGMPEGHLPVRSYLAVPVKTAPGEVIGGLFFGHPKPGVFTERTEALVLAIAAQAAIAFDNARLHRAAQAELEERRRMEAALTRADRQKDEFLAMLAHELRNPLAPITNASELLLHTLRPEGRTRIAIDMIRRQAAHLTRLVDDLLDVSRITQGRIHLKRQSVDLADVIAQALEIVEPRMREKGLQLSNASSGRERACVAGDLDRLIQCVANVLANAAKYTDAGGQIRIETRTEGEIAIIEISDTGAGIAPDLLPRVFDLFVQSDSTLDRSQGGLGIGLALVKQLVEMHEGKVIARSQGIGQGAAFEIRLPRITPPEPSQRASARASPFQ